MALFSLEGILPPALSTSQPWVSILLGGVLAWAIGRSIYNYWFHPFAKYPGPRLAALSSIWYAYIWLSGQYPFAIERAFRQYGEVIRVRPNELTFITPEAYSDIYSQPSASRPAFLKTKQITEDSNDPGLFTERDPQKHRLARRIWSPSFKPQTLPQYAPIIDRYVGVWLEKLRMASDSSDSGVNMTEWFEFIGTDIGGYIIFGSDYGHCSRGNAEGVCQALRDSAWWGTVRVALRPWSYLFPLSYVLLPPKALFALLRINKENEKALTARIRDKNTYSDVDYMTTYLNEVPKDQVKTAGYLASQGLAVLAGHVESMTVATAAMFFLMKNPETEQRLRSELRKYFKQEADLTDEALQRVPWLNAVVNESLRIQTNVPYGLPRSSPGAVVDGHYIPKGYVVSSAAFSTTHSPKYFAKPREFRPERWLPKDHPWHDKTFDSDDRNAFRPFSMGTRGCLAGGMAQYLLRVLIGRLCWKYKWEMLNKGDVDWLKDAKFYILWDKPNILVKFHEVS